MGAVGQLTLHNSPPIKSNINSRADARLLYRLSCKGKPTLSLPRQDAPEWLAVHIAGGYRTPRGDFRYQLSASNRSISGKIWVMVGQILPQFAPAEQRYYNDIWNSSEASTGRR
jgi:hypothetical protein